MRCPECGREWSSTDLAAYDARRKLMTWLFAGASVLSLSGCTALWLGVRHATQVDPFAAFGYPVPFACSGLVGALLVAGWMLWGLTKEVPHNFPLRMTLIALSVGLGLGEWSLAIVIAVF
ncbi:MAG: hypothetical protein ACKVU4_05805 [Phycisphaerales bacterium]